jgi:hypothetical protein
VRSRALTSEFSFARWWAIAISLNRLAIMADRDSAYLIARFRRDQYLVAMELVPVRYGTVLGVQLSSACGDHLVVGSA